MAQNLNTDNDALESSDIMQTLVVRIDDHYFGAPIYGVEDVINRLPTTPVMQASKNIVGVLNLRGHIVTEIDVARTLDIERNAEAPKDSGYSVVISKNNEMYSLAFDGLGEVINIPENKLEPLPNHINPKWSNVAKGVYRMDEKVLLVVLDLEAMIERINNKDTE